MIRFFLVVVTLPIILISCVAQAADPDPYAPRVERIAAQVEASEYEAALAAGRTLLAELEAAHPAGCLAEARLLDELVTACYRGSEVMNPEALVWAERAVALKTELLGPLDPGTATSLAEQGNLYSHRWEAELAIPPFANATQILLDAGAGFDAQRARVLSSLGVAYRRRADRDNALRVLQEARRIQEPGGDANPDLASTLNNQAVVLAELGEYGAAVQLHRRAMQIREKAFGPDSEWVAESANNLSNQLGYLGHWDESLAAQERAVDIFARTLGPTHPRRWWSLMNLGVIYQDMGDLERAGAILDEAYGNLSRILGPEHVHLVWVLDAQANNFYQAGDPERALEVYTRSLQLAEKKWGVGSANTADTIAQIGKCLIALHRSEEAIEKLTRSLEIKRADAESNNALLVDPLHERARAHLDRGDAAAALRDAEDSAELCRRDLGAEHPLLARSMLLAAEAERDLGRPQEALEAALEAERIGRQHLHLTLPVLSESLALQYADSRTEGLSLALSLLQDGGSGERVERVWDAAIRARAGVLDEFAARNRRLHAGDDPTLAALIDSSRAVREQLAHLTLRGPGWEEIADYRRMLDAAQERLHGLDRELSLRSGGRQGAESAQNAQNAQNDESGGLAAVRARLPEGAALVAYVRESAERAGEPGPSRYGVFVLAGADQPAVFRRLGATAEIDAAVSAWREQVVLGGASARGFVNVGRDAAERLAACTAAGDSLRRRIWDAPAALVGSAQTVFVVPSGSLHLVGFAALPAADGRYLIEQDTILHTLSAEREILAGAPTTRVASDLLVLGGADYGALDDDEIAVRGETRFTALPHTLDEVLELRSIWERGGGSVRILAGAEATEPNLKRLAGQADVLHLATHGFFLPSPGQTGAKPVRANPLVRAGLALTGANGWDESDGANDGILTAQEIAVLDLGRLRWVVLSACDTGLGDLGARGEGVFGLRRAFALAGARTVIMSLWPVEDEGARVWMRALYAARWEEGASTCEAVRTATRTLLAQRRAAGQSDHPYHWAGFIAAGDWR